MKLKKMMAAVLAASMVLSLGACTNSGSASTDTTAADKETEAADTKDADSTEAAADTETEDAEESAGNVINSDPANTEKTDKTITIALSSEPASIIGVIVGESVNEELIMTGALLDTLVKLDSVTGEVSPALALEWEWLDDYRIEFTLRDDVVMTDGTPFVADDVVYTVKTLATQSPNNEAGQFFDTEKTEAVDDTHVIVAFNCISPDLLSMLGWTEFGIFSEDEINALGGYDAAADNPVFGSGRYTFKEWVQGQYILLERNENYWDDTYAGYYKTIKITFASDSASREMAIEAGNAQATTDIDIAQATAYAANPNLKVTTYTYGQVYHVWFNMRDSVPMQNVKVREAIDAALDYEALTEYLTGGSGEQSLGYIESDVAFASDYNTVEERAQDLDKAKELLEEAGYGDGLTIDCIALAAEEGMYTLIQYQLSQVGITLNINVMDTGSYVQSSNSGDYDLIVVGEYLDTRNPSMMVFFKQQNIDSFCIGGSKYTTDEIEGLIWDTIEAKDNDAAAEPLSQLMQIIKNDTLCVNICPQMNVIITASNIKGACKRERGFMDLTTFYEDGE